MQHPSAQQGLTGQEKRLRKAWFGLSVAAVAIVLLVTLVVVEPGVPGRVVLLTGPQGSAYHDLGQRYAEDLVRRGLEAEVVITGGALDNMRRLAKAQDTVAFAPSTVDWESEAGLDTSSLVALGIIGFEPVWLFYRSDLGFVRIPDLAGRRVVSAGTGTAGDHVARVLIESNGLAGEVELQSLAEPTAESLADGFAAGTIDAVFATGAARSPIVAALLGAEGVSFLPFERAEAYAALIPGLTTLVASEGVLDLARNVPPQDAQVLATTTCLIAHESLHQAIVPMLLEAATHVDQKATSFTTAVDFPSREHVTLPLDLAARRYFSQGQVGLSKFLPYRVTRLLNHLGFLVLPLLTAALVLLKLVPAGLRMRFGLRMKGFFKELVAVEKRHARGAEQVELLAELERIDQASAEMFVPQSAVHDYIPFRHFLHDLRERVSP